MVLKDYKIIRTATVPLSLNYLLKGQLKFLNETFNVIAVSAPGPDLDIVAVREGVATYTVDMERKISIIKDLNALFRMYRLLRKEKPDLVHSITPKAGLVTMTAAYFAKVPIRIHTFTGLIFPSKKGILQKILIIMDKILCRFATHIFPEGQGVKNDLIKFGITRKPLRIIANGNVNGIDTDYFNPMKISDEERKRLKTRLNINEGDFVFIFIGRLVKDKGIVELINAFSRIKKEDSAYSPKLLLVGPLEQELDPLPTSILDIIDNDKRILTTGFQNDVRSFLAISDCLTFPSYREGFPNVVLQAGAMELPSIVSDINGCNEIIISEKNGIIIPPRNEKALFKEMVQMMNKPEKVSEMKLLTRSIIKSKYEQRVVWEAVKKEYETILYNEKS